MNVSDVMVESNNLLDNKLHEKALFRYISPDRKEEFFNKGFKERHFFPHKILYLPKSGPDGYSVATRIFGEVNPANMIEVIIYADSPVLEEFPDSLFFNDDLIWHRQQFGKKGHIAVASLFLEGKNLYSFIHFSDVYQRISRYREYKTRIENRFKGWSNLLLNSILNFALENKIENIFTPTSELALEHTDKKRNVKKPLFDRIYNLSVNRYYKAEKDGRWWKINLIENEDKIVIPEKGYATIENEKTICLAHDIERGLGHLGIDKDLVTRADMNYLSYIKEMSGIEKSFNIPATYNVVGCIMNDVRDHIDINGHCLAFHSFNHNIEEKQLNKCREVDYRIKGYRTPQSKITPELAFSNLAFNNFEWLASSVSSFKIREPKLESGVVKIPILFDDHSMYKDKIGFNEWENRAIKAIQENDFVAFCLHDCYASYWLPYYKNFLDKIHSMGKFKTFDQVAEEEFLKHAF